MSEPEQPPTTPATQTPPPAGQRSASPWRQLGRMAAPRATKAQILATLMALLLGFAIVAQVRQTSLQGLEALRQEELVRILDNVDQDQTRLADETRALELARQRLRDSTTTDTELARQAQDRLDALGILAGTVPAQGPGIILRIDDPEAAVSSLVLLDALQELRDAGAEAIQIGEQRVVASSAFTQQDARIELDGQPLTRPFVFQVIGDGPTLAAAMEIPGGVGNTVRGKGGTISVEIKDVVQVSALQTVSPPQYARPVPQPSPTP